MCLRPNTLRCLAFIIPFVGLVGCGSGSENTPSTPSINNPPTLNVVVDNDAPQEGQSFNLDARSSTDLDGDPLSFSWRQTAGLPLDIPNSNAQFLSFNVPELTETSTAIFLLEISDGTNIVSREIAVSLTNIDQTPKFSGGFTEQKTLSFGKEVVGFFPMLPRELSPGDTPSDLRDVWFVAVAESMDDTVSLEELFFDETGDIALNPVLPLLDTFSPNAKFISLPQASRTGNRVSDLLVVEEDVNLVSGVIFDRFENQRYETQFRYDIDTPCTAEVSFLEAGEIANGFIGQRNKGVSRLVLPTPLQFEIDFDSLQDLEIVADGTSLCEFIGDFSGQTLAVDFNNLTVRRYNGNGVLEVPLGVNTNEQLSIIASTRINDGIALVLSDGKHTGIHRMIYIEQDTNDEIVQVTKSWEIGVPSDIAIGNLDEDPFSATEITVVSSTSPEAIIFRFSDEGTLTTPPNGAPFISREPRLPISDAEYLEIGLGAEKGVVDTSTINDEGFTGLFITYPDDQVVRLLGNR